MNTTPVVSYMNAATLQAHIDNTVYKTLWPSDMNLSNKSVTLCTSKHTGITKIISTCTQAPLRYLSRQTYTHTSLKLQSLMPMIIQTFQLRLMSHAMISAMCGIIFFARN